MMLRKKLRNAIGGALGAAVVIGALAGAVPANAVSKGNLDHAWQDYINGVSTGTMTPQGSVQRWEFTYNNGNGTSTRETYTVDSNSTGPVVHYTYYGAELFETKKLPHVDQNAK